MSTANGDPDSWPAGRALFLDAELQSRFDRDGYVVVPWLSTGDAVALRDEFQRLLPEHGFGSHYTSQSSDVAYRRQAFEVIARAFETAVAGCLDRCRPVVANFFAKEPAPDTAMVIHQDWAFVDEQATRSINVWCPLEDATVRNGTLHVLPGSHRAFDNLRGTAQQASGLPSPFAGIEGYTTERYLQAVEVPAGSAIINDHRLVHSSPDNRSRTLRVAASLTLVPAEERVRHYFGDGERTVDIYEIDDAELCQHLIGSKPRGRLVGSIDYTRAPLSESELDDLMAAAGVARRADPHIVQTDRRSLLRRLLSHS